MAGETVKGRLRGLAYSRRGKQLLTIEIDGDFGERYDALSEKELDITIAEHREKRSKNANAYMWELCGLLSETTGLPSIDIYRNSIRHVGVYRDVEFTREKDAKAMTTAWSFLGTGWFSEKLDYAEDGNGIVMRCYYGSSSYNKKQMARLIDDLAEDCKALGIDCDTEQIKSLINDWKGKDYA